MFFLPERKPRKPGETIRALVLIALRLPGNFRFVG